MQQSNENDWFILKLDHAEQLVVFSNNSESTISEHYKNLMGHFLVVTDIQGYHRYSHIKLLDLSAQLSMSLWAQNIADIEVMTILQLMVVHKYSI